MQYFNNANIVRHFYTRILQSGIHLCILLPVYISILTSHYLNVQNPYSQLIRITLTVH